MRTVSFGAMVVWLIAACSSGAPLQTTGPSVAQIVPATMSPVPTSSPAPPPTPAAASTIHSDVYPYSWTLAPNIADVPWRAAPRGWNGIETISQDAPYMDRTSTVDGALLVFGTAWSGSLDAFKNDIVAKVASQHGCARPTSYRSVEVDGAKAFAFPQSCTDVPVTRVITLKAGTGMVISGFVVDGKVAVALDDLVTWLRGWTWNHV